MPMMEYKGLVACVLCRNKPKEESPEPVKGEVEQHAKEITVDALKPVEEVSLAWAQ